MIRPTRRAILAFSVGVPLALFLVIRDPALWALSFDYGAVVLVVIATDALLAFPHRFLRLDFSVPERLFIGEQGSIAAAAAPTRYRWPVRMELLAEQEGDADPAEPVEMTLHPGEGARAALPMVPRRRGRIQLNALWVRWRGPLGLVEMMRRVALGRAIDVVPNVRGLHSTALNFFAQEAIFGLKLQQPRGEGTEFDSLRDYTAGLDHRSIDWKHSARHRKLLCKEFKSERNHHVVLAFDTGYLMREPIDGIPRLDHAINAALLLTWVSLQGGDLVGTYAFDAAARHYLQPIRGIAGFARIQKATAELAYRSDETNFTLGLAELNVRLKRRALVILFTEFVDTVTAELLVESLQRVANRHVVVFVTLQDSLLQRSIDKPPAHFTDVAGAVVAHDLLRERRIVLERIERLGIHCIDVPSRGLSTALINRYLLIKQRGLI